VIEDMWEEVFDPTLHDPRYAVNREKIADVAEEFNTGPTKVADIAKNPKAMKAAIVGDHRASQAAVEGLEVAGERDPLTRASILAMAERLRHTPRPPVIEAVEMTDEEICQHRLDSVDHAAKRIDDYEVPPTMRSYTEHRLGAIIERLENKRMVLRFGDDLDQLPTGSGTG
jgi:hypothetical protein